ncbi:hypothetical protein [Alkalibacter mobilis]|uniref:hypothetical protein n=1 Tax=Alkalibacter mobilis TaxID=2787712 RepID=UPI00189F8A6B|nr:hypothetical protein [Alkalibacter mobilis]MBF7097877.1 hypothetical protein [Alkalibacter mobilis]
MIKRVTFLLVLFTCLTMLGCTSNVSLDKDKEVVESFLQRYFGQITMSSSDWNEWEEIMRSDSDYKDWEFLKEFKTVLSEPCLERMVSNRLLPNLQMKELDMEALTIKDQVLVKKDEGTYTDSYKNKEVDYTTYDVSYTLDIEKNGSTTSFSNINEIRIISECDKRIIDNMSGEFVWK